jgi:iron(III) transport system substrate-binding protein
MKKFLALLCSILLLFTTFACSSNNGGNTNNDDNVDWEHMSMEELYEMAKQEGGVVKIYATTTDAETARKKIARDYPDVNFEFVSCDTNTIKSLLERDYDANKVNADVVLVKDASGEIYNGLVAYDILKIYYPETICKHIDPDLLQYGLPLYSTFNPWFYSTRDFPDGVPITSWWDIVQGYNVDTKSYKDANGKDTQYWTVYTKDIKGASYAALWAQLFVDSDLMFAQYKEQYGKDLDITYTDKLQNDTFKNLPENNAGVELFWRFTQMQTYEQADGDAVANAVDLSVNGPTIGLCSASKLDNRDSSGMQIGWVTGLSPYTAQNAASYVYVAGNCDNPAGARLYINYIMGGDDGQSGCYQTFDKLGHWSVRDDVVFEKSGVEEKDVGLKAPDMKEIYNYFVSVQSYWDLWTSWR